MMYDDDDRIRRINDNYDVMRYNDDTINIMDKCNSKEEPYSWSYLHPRKQLPPKHLLLFNITQPTAAAITTRGRSIDGHDDEDDDESMMMMIPPIVDTSGNNIISSNNIITEDSNKEYNLIHVFRYIADTDKIVHHNGNLDSKFNNIIITNNNKEEEEGIIINPSNVESGSIEEEEGIIINPSNVESGSIEEEAIINNKASSSNGGIDDSMKHDDNNNGDDDDCSYPMWGYENSNIPQPMKTRKASEAKKKGFGYNNIRGNTSLLNDAFTSSDDDNNNN